MSPCQDAGSARGDRYCTISLPLLGYTFVQSLRSDRPDEALANLEAAIHAWPYPQFQMQHCDALLGEVETRLYAGEAERAVTAMARDWPYRCGLTMTSTADGSTGATKRTASRALPTPLTPMRCATAEPTPASAP